MPRRKYFTEAERREAKRKQNREYYRRKKQQREQVELFNSFGDLMNIDPNLYSTREHLTDDQKDFIHSLMYQPISTPNIQRQTRSNSSEAKRQLGLARSKIRTHSTLDFDLTRLQSEEDRQFFYEHFSELIYSLLDSIDFNSEHWMIYYFYDDHWKSRTLDEVTQRYLRDQVENNLRQHLHDYFEYNTDYDFFPVMIQSLHKIRIVNIDVEPKRKKRQGSFWKWFLKGFPDLNLERFMIFRQLNKPAVHIINKDNCFIYACRMSGLSDDIINALRYSIHKRSMSTHDLNKVCRDLQLRVHVKEPGRSYTINPNGIHDVRMIRFHEHYMIDEPVDVSPYYILHHSEIMKEKPFMPRYRKTRVIGKTNGKYVVAPIGQRFSLMAVLNALFKVEAFVPITMNDYRVYSSLVCFENIDPIKKLDYNPQFCVKLKQIK